MAGVRRIHHVAVSAYAAEAHLLVQMPQFRGQLSGRCVPRSSHHCRHFTDAFLLSQEIGRVRTALIDGPRAVPRAVNPVDNTVSVVDISGAAIVQMSEKHTDPEDLLPLTPAVFHILLVLADGERHGYAIMERVAQITDGQIRMGAGTLYGTIKRLLQSKLIDESEERPDSTMDDERRRYYRLTDFGRRVLTAEAERYTRLVRVAQMSGLLARPQST